MISADLLNRPVEKGAVFGLTLSARFAEPGDRATASVPRSYRLGRPFFEQADHLRCPDGKFAIRVLWCCGGWNRSDIHPCAIVYSDRGR